MEWVETTGKTIEEAKEAALDQLGVDEEEAEFEVLEEPKSGLFGRVRREARVRARIEPKRPRPKTDRRERRRRKPKGDGGDDRDAPRNGNRSSGRSGTKGKRNAGAGASGTASAPSAPSAPDEPAAKRSATTTTEVGTASTTGKDDAKDERGPERSARAQQSRNGDQQQQGERMSSETVSMDEQAAIIEEFLEGLVDAFGLDTDIKREDVDDELVEVQVEAADLGLLIGPKGQTLGAIQELSRTVLQRKATGVYEGRVRIDIGGYRNRRRAALERFATSVAEQVRASGKQKVLEPMNPADRKIVHDTINDLDGVSTSSEGTEPYRRVVIRPADD